MSRNPSRLTAIGLAVAAACFTSYTFADRRFHHVFYIVSEKTLVARIAPSN
ncbi:MAG: hypothetical protein Q8K97_00555 [Pseudohongiella sp.]|nr:hypothetical protein [Pseudohongiella sp.]MDP2125840.1 hypothetical protein [Pseudohongiella sp.]